MQRGIDYSGTRATMRSNTVLLYSVFFIAIVTLVNNANGYGFNKDFIPNTWIEKGIYENGKIDYSVLRIRCNEHGGEYLDQGTILTKN